MYHLVRDVENGGGGGLVAVRLSLPRRLVARQAPLFSRQEYWGRLPFPSPGDLSDSEIEPASPALASRVFTSESLG